MPYKTWSKNAWTELKKLGQRRAKGEPYTDCIHRKAAKEQTTAQGGRDDRLMSSHVG